MKKTLKTLKNIIKWALIIVGILAIAAVVYAFSQGKNPIQSVMDSTDDYSEVKEESHEESKPVQAEAKVYKIGETANINGVEYRLEKVERFDGGQYDKPEEGDMYIKCTVSITNNSDRKESYNSYDWRMVNSQGQEDGATHVMDVDNQMDGGDLIHGGSVSGVICFEEPTDSEWFRLNVYDNGMWDEDPIATWGFKFENNKSE